MAKSTKTKKKEEEKVEEELVSTPEIDYDFSSGEEVRCTHTHHHYHVFEIDYANDIVYAEQKAAASHPAKWYGRSSFKTWKSVF